jgi:nucleoside phosphorylase
LADCDVILVQGGIGRDRARRAVAAAARAFHLRAVWSLGFAGGLRDTILPGALVYPGDVLDDVDPFGERAVADRSHASVCASMRAAGLAVDVGSLITVADPLRTPGAKRAVGHRSGAVAVDMEAAGIVRAARDLGIPWIALKAVVDAVDDPLPAFLAACTTPAGDLRWRGLWAGAREGRAFWRSLRRVGRASRWAGRSLRQGLETAFSAWAALTPV